MRPRLTNPSVSTVTGWRAEHPRTWLRAAIRADIPFYVEVTSVTYSWSDAPRGVLLQAVSRQRRHDHNRRVHIRGNHYFRSPTGSMGMHRARLLILLRMCPRAPANLADRCPFGILLVEYLRIACECGASYTTGSNSSNRGSRR